MTHHQFVELPTQRLAYRESTGQGRPVILVHGNSSSSRTWQRLLEGPFGQRFRCLAPDLPGHGNSPRATAGYSIPLYTRTLAAFARATKAHGALVVGWSLGGHIALEAASELPEPAGFALFGTPPLAGPESMGEAFLPHPALGVGFSSEVSPDEARAYALSQLAPGSPLSPAAATADILTTDPAARTDLAATLASGAFADELTIARELQQPLALLQGSADQLVSLAYLQSIAPSLPTLWRGEVHLIPAAGHSPQEETPEALACLLTEFESDLGPRAA
ncbi:alpha/beta fold hydrolase [Kitasatospora kifunensis]|uniref:Pimeloyl-ACP methyl ester carboxylesterase n=1 Tax=Kitasatospora kifunensis TaxID=58351 RepID=A0A7W7VW59_KITKI|nr:alpha/beta hydrolase [Kitasatospora kifunensis]MBB4925152.1 pimeloyl-ACP methyl ester carboxylesterase [Kitasatospora kifunensis]